MAGGEKVSERERADHRPFHLLKRIRYAIDSELWKNLCLAKPGRLHSLVSDLLSLTPHPSLFAASIWSHPTDQNYSRGDAFHVNLPDHCGKLVPSRLPWQPSALHSLTERWIDTR